MQRQINLQSAPASPLPSESNTMCAADLQKNGIDAGIQQQQHQDSFGPSLSELAFWMEIEPGPNPELVIGVTPSTQRQAELELCEPIRYGKGRDRPSSIYCKLPKHKTIVSDSLGIDSRQVIKTIGKQKSICNDEACYLYLDLQRCLLSDENESTLLNLGCDRPGCTPFARHASEPGWPQGT